MWAAHEYMCVTDCDGGMAGRIVERTNACMERGLLSRANIMHGERPAFQSENYAWRGACFPERKLCMERGLLSRAKFMHGEGPAFQSETYAQRAARDTRAHLCCSCMAATDACAVRLCAQRESGQAAPPPWCAGSEMLAMLMMQLLAAGEI
eukprot:363451-Chlamydomonas_euryale.AAC.4